MGRALFRFWKGNVYLCHIVFRADHAAVYAAEIGTDHFGGRRCLRRKFLHVLEGEKEEPVGNTEYRRPETSKNGDVFFIKGQALAADGSFRGISRIVRIFRFDQESRDIRKGRFYMLQKKRTDSAVAVIFYNSEIIQKASAFVRENGKKCIS